MARQRCGKKRVKLTTGETFVAADQAQIAMISGSKGGTKKERKRKDIIGKK